MTGHRTQGRSEERSFRAAGDPRDILEQLIQLLGEGDVSTRQLYHLAAKLQRLIERRFAGEERSDRHEEIMVHAPWLTATAQAMRQQHDELRQSLRRICRAARSVNSTCDGPRCLQRTLSDFGERYMEHEVSEQNLLHDAYRGPAWAGD